MTRVKGILNAVGTNMIACLCHVCVIESATALTTRMKSGVVRWLLIIHVPVNNSDLYIISYLSITVLSHIL